jgi:protein TonB
MLLPLAIRYFFPAAPVVPKVLPQMPQYKPQVYTLPKVKPVLPSVTASQPTMAVTPHSVIQTRVAPDPEVLPVVDSKLPPDIGATGPATVGVENPTGASGITGPTTVPGTDTALSEPAASPEAALTAEVMPDFVGGRAALQRYLQKHLRFPAAALAAQVSGKVYVTFVVQADGNIGEVTVLKGLGYGTEEAAARVVREMPAWTPGMQNHHSVAVRFTLPITFQYE